jgi:hypothetical protein
MHVVLAIDTQILRDALEALLEVCYDVHIAARASDEIAIAVLLRTLLGDEPFDADEPVALIISFHNESERPAFCSRLLEEFPEVVIFGIEQMTGSIRSYRMKIEVHELVGTLNSLESALRAISRESPHQR